MIKKLLENLKTDYQDYWKNHLITNIFLLIAIVLIIFNDESETSYKLITMSLSTAMFTLFTECFTKKRNIPYVISIVLGILIGTFADNSDYTRIIMGILLTTPLGIIYLMMKNSKMPSDKYITQAFTNLLKVGIIGAIINIGIMLILALFSGLIYELEYTVFAKIEAIIIIAYFIPTGIISLEKKEEENARFIYVLNNYVLLPLVTTATAIIYLYILKLIMTLKLPDTSIFGMLAALLIFGIPTVLMVLSYEEKNTFNKIADKLRYLFIPLLILQTYAITLRIKEFSFTDSRYAAVMLLIIGISAVVLLIKEKKNFKLVLIPTIILILIATIPPYINMEEFPNYMQIKRLTKIMPKGTKFEDLTPEKKQQVISIRNYVTNTKYYPEYLLEEEFPQNYNQMTTQTIYYYERYKNKINIEDYTELERYSYTISKFQMEIENEKYDLRDFAKRVYDQYTETKDIYGYMEENNIIHISDKIDFYIVSMNLNYHQESLRLEGYILYKGEQ